MNSNLKLKLSSLPMPPKLLNQFTGITQTDWDEQLISRTRTLSLTSAILIELKSSNRASLQCSVLCVIRNSDRSLFHREGETFGRLTWMIPLSLQLYAATSLSAM